MKKYRDRFSIYTDEDPCFIWCPGESFDDEDDVRMCCSLAANPQDVVKDFDYLIGNANVFPNLTAVNLSMANNTFHESTCDDILYFNYYQSLLNNGVIPVLASGNEYTNGSLPESAGI